MSDDDLPVFPIASWTHGPLPSMGVILFQPHYLVSPMQPIEQAAEGKRFVLTPEQARVLIEDLKKALNVLETSASGGSEFPRH